VSRRRRRRSHRLALGAVLAVLAPLVMTGCGSGGEGARLTVLGASSLTEALGEYGESFGPAEVRSSFAGSDQLAAQIRQGAEPDVFASADAEFPAGLHAEGLLGRPVVFARNRLVAIVPAGSPARTLGALALPGTGIAIGDPSVPVGAYARAVLGRLPAGEGAAILANVRSEEPEVSSIAAKVAGGAADAGFVYRTDARALADRVETIAIPPRLQPDIAYAVGVGGDSEHPSLARRYVAGMLRGAGAAALREAGFLPPP
jgi:molybdate transport system substrate-binding protein